MSDSFLTSWTGAHQDFLSMGFPRQEYWKGCHFLLQGIFLAQGSNLCLLHCRQIPYRWAIKETHKDHCCCSVTQSCLTHLTRLFTISQSLLKLMCTESVMPSNHPVLCHPLIFLPSIFPSISSVSVISNSLWPHGLQHARLPCPLPSPKACSNSCPSSRWCYPTISFSVVPFSRLQSFPASGSFPMSQFFASGGQIIGVSAKVLEFQPMPKNVQTTTQLHSSHTLAK